MTTYDGQDLLIDGATITINGPHEFNSIHLMNGAILTHSAKTATATYKLDLTVAEQVIVKSTSKIDVSGRVTWQVEPRGMCQASPAAAAMAAWVEAERTPCTAILLSEA